MLPISLMVTMPNRFILRWSSSFTKSSQMMASISDFEMNADRQDSEWSCSRRADGSERAFLSEWIQPAVCCIKGKHGKPVESKTSKHSNRKRTEQVLGTASQLFAIIWAGTSAWWTKPFFAEYYQSMANSHLEPWGTQLLQMGPVFALAAFFSVRSLIHKQYFIAILTAIIATWAFYRAFLTSFVCLMCGV